MKLIVFMEWFLLIPIWLTLGWCAVDCFYFRTDGVGGLISLAAVFFCLVIVGAAHPGKTWTAHAGSKHLREQRQETPELAHEESYAAAKAMLSSMVLFAIAITALSLHWGHRWWSLLHGLIAYVAEIFYAVLVVGLYFLIHGCKKKTDAKPRSE